MAEPKSCDHVTGGPLGGLHESSITGQHKVRQLSTRADLERHELALRRPASVQAGYDRARRRGGGLRRHHPQVLAVPEHDVSGIGEHDVPAWAADRRVTLTIPER